MSFKKKSHDFLQINPTGNRVEYAQLKKYGENISTLLTTSDPSEVKNYNPAGAYHDNYNILHQVCMTLHVLMQAKCKPTKIIIWVTYNVMRIEFCSSHIIMHVYAISLYDPAACHAWL